MADPAPPPPTDAPADPAEAMTPRPGDRPEPRNRFERFLRRFENPSTTDLIMVCLIVPTVALLVLIIVAWLI